MKTKYEIWTVAQMVLLCGLCVPFSVLDCLTDEVSSAVCRYAYLSYLRAPLTRLGSAAACMAGAFALVGPLSFGRTGVQLAGVLLCVRVPYLTCLRVLQQRSRAKSRRSLAARDEERRRPKFEVLETMHAPSTCATASSPRPPRVHFVAKNAENQNE